MKKNKVEDEKVQDEVTDEEIIEESGEDAKDNLAGELESLKKQLDDEKDRYIRLAAEFDNLRKRSQNEKEKYIKYANEQLILELLNVWESLGRGLENARESNNKDKLIEGMELVHKQFQDVLEKNGLSTIKAVGEKFDPYRHEAVMITQTDECEEDTVLEEFTKGYMLNNNVIRYSKVRVSKNKEE